MELVYILLLVACFFSFVTIRLAKIKFASYLNHYSVYNVAWLIFICLSIFCNTYAYAPSSTVYQIFLIGLICYNFTVFFVKSTRHVKGNIYAIDIKYRRALELVVIISLFPMAYMNFKLIQAGVELWKLNYDYWNSIRNSGSYLYNVYLQNIIAPLSMLLIFTPYCSNKLYINANKYTPVLSILLAAVISIEYTLLTGGGRSQMMRFVYVCIFSYIAYGVNTLRPYYYKFSGKIYVLMLFLCLIIIQWANVGRGKSDDLFQNAIDGQIIFAPLFEYYLTQTDVFINNTYGASMFEFFVTFIQYPLKLLGLTFYEYYNSDFVQNFIYVPSLAKEVNASVSAYFYYMRDFGFVGIFLGPIITASLMNFLYSFSFRNIYYLIFYISGIFPLMMTTDYPFQKNFWLAFFYLLLFVFLLKRRSGEVG